MRPLRYTINVTLDGCCDHQVMIADEELHRHAIANLERADAVLFGRVVYQMMEEFWRPFAQTGTGPDWMLAFARTIDAAKKYVVSSTLERVDWNAELIRGDLADALGHGRNAVTLNREIAVIRSSSGSVADQGITNDKIMLHVHSPQQSPQNAARKNVRLSD